MTTPLLRSLTLPALVLISLSAVVHGQDKTFEREYAYKASEFDSKASCRVVAINQLRLELLNEVGVYVESESILETSEAEGKFTQNFREDISTLTAGVTRLKVLEEKWDGETFWMKASITINEQELANALNQVIADRQKLKELEALKVQLSNATRELEELRKIQQSQPTQGTSTKETYLDKINSLDAANHFFVASSLAQFENFEEALAEYSRAIALQPNNVDAYHNRGVIRANNKDFAGAIVDFTSAIKISPSYDLAYFNRGNAKDDLMDYRNAVLDFDQAVKLDPGNSDYYNNRGIAKGHLGDYNGAIKDYSSGLVISPMDAEIYYNRGLAKLHVGQQDSGCKDLHKAGELGYEQANKSMAKKCN